MPTESKHNGLLSIIRKQAAALRRLLRTSRGHDIAVYCLFLAISYGFWVIMRLNDVDQRDFDVSLHISGVPNNVTFISDPPKDIHVTVRDQGVALLRYDWGSTKPLDFSYADFTYDEVNDRLVLSSQKLNARLRDIYSGSAQIMTVRPDSLSLVVTTRKPSMAKVIPDVSVTTSSQTVISGPITVRPDSVRIYTATHAALPELTVHTEKLIRTGLEDTLRVKLEIIAPKGAKVVPSSVTITVPVEPLMAKKEDVSVHVVNSGTTKYVLFPSTVSVSYLVPMSLYHSTKTGPIIVRGDFAKRSDDRIPIEIVSASPQFMSIELATDSIEYLIEE